MPATPPKEALIRRRQDANTRFRGEYVHTIPNGSDSKQRAGKKQRRDRGTKGYRPGRKGAQ